MSISYILPRGVGVGVVVDGTVVVTSENRNKKLILQVDFNRSSKKANEKLLSLSYR